MGSDYIQEQDPSQPIADMDGYVKDYSEALEEEAGCIARLTRPNRGDTVYPPNFLFLSMTGRGRIAKPKYLRASKQSKAHSVLICRTCEARFNGPLALQNHIDNSHPRAFTCVFNFAGCESSFASKNEWKRHVSTQHLILNTWVCNLDNCGIAHTEPSSSSKKYSVGASSRGAIFNRKDLFTQHLRRMHAPPLRHANKEKSAWEDRIKDLQEICQQVNRQSPRVLRCPVAECGVHFGGSKCWDDYMEHVAKHLEKAAVTKDAPSVRHEIEQLFVAWALQEGVINLLDGEYKLTSTSIWLDNGLGQDAEGEDEDAEGEDEDAAGEDEFQQFHRPGPNQSYPSQQRQKQVDYPQHFDQDAKSPFYLSGDILMKRKSEESATVKMEYTDSGYYSSNARTNVDKAEVAGPDATDIAGDDTRTIYSAVTAVMPEIAHQSISDICRDIYRNLEPHVDDKTWEYLSSTIPELIKTLALRLGLGSSDEFNRRIMHFVHKHHQCVLVWFSYFE